MVLALALAVELLPPLSKVVQARVEVNEDLGGLAILEQGVADSGVLCSRVLLIRHVGRSSLLHILCALDDSANVPTCHSNRQQTNRREDREATANVVRNNVSLVALLGSERAERTFGFVGNGYDTFACFVLADLLLEHCLEQTESESGLGGCAGFGDVNDAELATLEQRHKVSQIILADIVAGIDHDRVLALGHICVERRSQCLVHGACAQI